MQHSRSSGGLQSYIRYYDSVYNKNYIYDRNASQKSYQTYLKEQLTPEKRRSKSLIAKSRNIKGKILGSGTNNEKNIIPKEKILNNFDKFFNNDEIKSKDSIDKNSFKTFLSKSIYIYIIFIAMEEFNQWKNDMGIIYNKVNSFDETIQKITSMIDKQNEKIENIDKKQYENYKNLEQKLDLLTKSIGEYVAHNNKDNKNSKK